jgi:hypothetical protein
VKTLALFILGAMVLGLLARVLVPRGSRFAEPTRLVSRLITNIGVAVILGWIAVGLAREGGGVWLVPAAILALLAVGEVLIAALFVWGFFRSPEIRK